MHGSTMSPANQYPTSQYFSPVSCLIGNYDHGDDIFENRDDNSPKSQYFIPVSSFLIHVIYVICFHNLIMTLFSWHLKP